MTPIKDSILEWFANGRVGVSSKAMVCAVIELPQDDKWGNDHPHDPDDFNRCLLLLAQVPEMRNHFNKIAEISEIWSKLINRWRDIERCFLDEVGLDWCKATNAPKTYDLMKTIINDTRQNR
ncbi:hypothetical protein LCGC14_2531340 [marine sediment metagenome]|uniref:Uncharacterized protein n=1 Tax=marine sediment metagenome TaxID=412755 RepID=A0A0F9D4Z1_9ZZZZ